MTGYETAVYVAAAVAAAGAVYTGYQANQTAKADAHDAEVNAKIAARNANAREEMMRRRNARILADQRAAAAQSGFDPSTGSLLKIQSESAGAAELDALTARYEGGLQSLSFQMDAGRTRAAGKSAQTTGYLNAAGALTGGAARYYGTSSSLRVNQQLDDTGAQWGGWTGQH